MTLPVPTTVPWQFDPANPLPWITANPTVGESINRLTGGLWSQWDRLRAYDAYYEGEQPLSFMSRAMENEIGTFVRAVVLNWPRIVADTYSSRLRLQGFRFAGSQETDDDLWATWQANNLDKLFPQGVLEAHSLSRAYVIVGSPEKPGDRPVITVESPFQVYATRDPRTRRVAEAVKCWRDAAGADRVTLYEPDRTVWTHRDGGQWIVDNVDDHNLGMVPVVPLVNRPRLLRPDGIAEFHDVIPIVDAAIKAATDMMISAEYHAMPRRWVFGLKKDDFKDQNGNQVSMWSKIAGRIWSSESAEVKVGQFDEASLANFHETIKLLAQLAAQVSALPANVLAFNAVNPASAEALQALDAQMVERVKGKQDQFGEDAEDVMRLVLRIQNGSWDPDAQSLEAVWASPTIESEAAKADRTMKLVSTRDGFGRSIVPIEQAREDLGYTPQQRTRMASMDEAAANDPAVRALAESLAGQVPAQQPVTPDALPAS